MLQILAVYGLLRSIGSAAAGLLGGTGRPGLTVVTNLLSLGFSIALIPIFEPFGPAGLAGAFTVGQAASTFSALIMTRRLRPERVMSLVRGVVLATAVGLGAALIIMPGITASANGPAALIVFGVVYVGMLLTLDRRLRADLITTVRSKVDAPAER
jgi:O-antigen/teichoic acid export membrane protein